MKSAIKALDAKLIKIDSDIHSFNASIELNKKYLKDYSARKEESIKERKEIVDAIEKLREENNE